MERYKGNKVQSPFLMSVHNNIVESLFIEIVISVIQEEKKGSQITVYKIKHIAPMMDLRKIPKCP